MSKKEQFIREIELANLKFTQDALDYFNALKVQEDKESPKFTSNGLSILKFMRENKETYNNLFSAKSTGEGMGISSKTVSGACRKLVTDGYLEKMGDKPSIYALTEKGVNENLDTE